MNFRQKLWWLYVQIKICELIAATLKKKSLSYLLSSPEETIALLLVFCSLYTGSHCQRGSLHQSQEHPQEHQHSERAQCKDPSSLALMGQGLLAVC